MRTALVAVALLSALASSAAPAVAPAVVSSVAYNYVPGDTDSGSPVAIAEGGRLFFANADADFHTVTAVDLGPDDEPLFDSGDPIGAGSVAEVAGVDALAPGRYLFHCTSHFGMTGTLEVVPV